MKVKLVIYASALALTAIYNARAQSPAGNAIPVTVDNFIRAESDTYAANISTAALESLFTGVSLPPSTIKPSSGSIETRCTRRVCSISMPRR